MIAVDEKNTSSSLQAYQNAVDGVHAHTLVGMQTHKQRHTHTQTTPVFDQTKIG